MRETLKIRHVRCRRTAACVLGLLAVVALAGCGGSNSGSSGTTVALIPAALGLPTGGSQAFIAVVGGTTDQAVAWTVTEGSTGGTITSSGVYTAPTTAGTYHVVATSSANVSLLGTAAVTVTTPGSGISVAPTSITLPASTTETFAATVPGVANSAVTWSVTEGSTGGTITSAGAYTSPTTAGTYHVVATSVADPSETATAAVTVQ